MAHVTAEVDEQFEAYEFAKVCDLLYHFAWDDVCDWYVELSKPVLAEAARRRRHPPGAGPRAGPAPAAAAPVIPFVTDELWSALSGGETVLTASWPVADRTLIDDAAEAKSAPSSGW
ncbi:class I tRNA ligase family protein [Micromonospora sp. BRA006-A]|nr:class I tRNA ligase family protein [Micromonospora sp. BRA006-A]